MKYLSTTGIYLKIIPNRDNSLCVFAFSRATPFAFLRFCVHFPLRFSVFACNPLCVLAFSRALPFAF